MVTAHQQVESWNTVHCLWYSVIVLNKKKHVGWFWWFILKLIPADNDDELILACSSKNKFYVSHFWHNIHRAVSAMLPNFGQTANFLWIFTSECRWFIILVCVTSVSEGFSKIFWINRCYQWFWDLTMQRQNIHKILLLINLRHFSTS